MFSAVVDDTEVPLAQREFHGLLLSPVEVNPLKALQGAQWGTVYPRMGQIELNDFIAGHGT